jgi:hypothetical protein
VVRGVGWGQGDDGWRAERMGCMWAADVDGLKGLKLGRYKNKTQGFGLEVSGGQGWVYIRRGRVIWISCCVMIVVYSAVHAGRHHLLRSGTCVCVCLVVGGTALVKMTQPIWHLDHLPNLRLGATRVTSATRGPPS